MKTTVEQLEPTRVKLTVAVSPEDLKPSIDHAYQHIAEQVNIPGFRKGKVPAPIIDQRVGRGEVIQHAINEGLDGFFRQAVNDEKVRILGRPSADVVGLPDLKDFSGDLVLEFEVDVRPELDLPKLAGLKITVDEATASDDEVTAELTSLRERFGTLKTVDRPAGKGDFVQLDLTASIGDTQVDAASGVSYEVGSGELLEGMDDAVETLTAGESTSFDSVLLGGEHEGQTALIEVTVTAVKERELPEVDDEFAQLASSFDTSEELLADIREQVGRNKVFQQGAQARDKVLEAIVEKVEVPVPAGLVEDEVHRHLDGEGRLEDDVHRAEVTEEAEKNFRNQILLDTLVEDREVEITQDEVNTYIVRSAMQYGMQPQEFVQTLERSGQLPAVVSEVARNKALLSVLGEAKVTDTAGKAVDLAEFIRIALGTPEETADEAPAEAEEAPAKKPAAKKAPAKKPAAKKAPAAKDAE